MKLSVIIPVHNGENYIRRCIESVHNAINVARLKEYEIVVIDDGSTDSTKLYVEEAMRHMPNIRLIIMDDEGVSAARNRGIEESTGEYISFVDADDIIDEGMFVKLLNAIETQDADIAGCGFFRWTDTNREYGGRESTNKIKIYEPSEYIDSQIIYGNSRCWSKVYRRDTIGTIRFREDLTIGEDMLFLTEVSLNSAKIIEMTQYDGYGYYINPNGAMARPFTIEYMDQIRCWELMKEYSKEEQLITNLIVAIMLVASKIALLSSREKKANNQYIAECHSKLKELTDMHPDRVNSLDRNYRIKVGLFLKSPNIYMMLYHLWK